jgi:alpha/beta superfamily hydrolase
MPPASSQLQIPGADHYFEGYHEKLAVAITAWLNSLPEPAN